MKRISVLLLLISAIMGNASSQDGDGSLLKVGDMAPQFSVTTIDGNVVDISKSKGKVVMINFFATWCGPCNQELPVLEKNIWNKYKDNKNFVLVIPGREHDTKTVKEFSETKNFKLPFAPDEKREIFAMYAEKNIPRTVIIGKDGKIVYQSVGYTEAEFKEMEELLANLLK